MGCCVSTSNTSPHTKTPNISKSKAIRKQSSKSPPHTNPLQEEETVKEVLSETPAIPKRPSPSFLENHRNETTPFIKNAPLLMAPEFSNKPYEKKQRNDAAFQKPYMVLGNDELSEEVSVSEICSTISESVSVSTTVTKKRENNGHGTENANKIRPRSPARSVNQSFSGEVKRDKSVGKSPGRRSEPSPGRIRPVPGQGYGRRKDSNGESSARRSRSPITRTDFGSSKTGPGRIQSAKRMVQSPSRAGSGERIRKIDAGKDNRDNNKMPLTSNESLENPLVSLECFIFL